MEKHISDFIKNNTRFLEKFFPKPKSKAIEHAIRKIFRTGEIKVKHIGNSHQTDKRTAGQKLSRLLEKEDLEEKIEDFFLKKFSSKIQKDTVIAYDLTDIAKPYSQKLENLSKVFDGSKRKKENGYFVHGLGIKEGLLALRVADQNRKFLPTERKEILEKFLEKLDYKGIWVFDRGNDDQKLFKFLSEKNTKFIVRLKRNRKVRIKIYEENSEKYTWSEWMSLDELEEGDFKVQIKSGKEYRLIIKENLEGKSPIRLITNLKKLDFNEEKVRKLYLERWCIEKQFKTMKTKFSLEEIQVRKFQAIKNLVAMVQLAMNLSQIFWENLEENFSALWRSIHFEFQIFCKKQSLNASFDAATVFLKSLIIEPFSSILNPADPSDYGQNSGQLSLGCDF